MGFKGLTLDAVSVFQMTLTHDHKNLLNSSHWHDKFVASFIKILDQQKRHHTSHAQSSHKWRPSKLDLRPLNLKTLNQAYLWQVSLSVDIQHHSHTNFVNGGQTNGRSTSKHNGFTI